MNLARGSFSVGQMTFSVSLIRCALLLLASFMLAGCLDSGQGQFDEEKEPHFLAGKSRVNSMDYPGAVESFEKALEVNPQSASAHFELGCLFDQKEADPAAAIYHYEHYLKLRPNADNAEIVKTRILACKQELARTVSLGPITQTLQREFEKLTEDNKRLTEETKRLQGELEQWRAYAARLETMTNGPAHPSSSRTAFANPSSSEPPASTTTLVSSANSTKTSGTRLAVRTETPRTHTVKAGETLTSIARQYGIRLEALRSANPHLNPRRLRPGQSLDLP